MVYAVPLSPMTKNLNGLGVGTTSIPGQRRWTAKQPAARQARKAVMTAAAIQRAAGKVTVPSTVASRRTTDTPKRKKLGPGKSQA